MYLYKVSTMLLLLTVELILMTIKKAGKLSTYIKISYLKHDAMSQYLYLLSSTLIKKNNTLVACPLT